MKGWKRHLSALPAGHVGALDRKLLVDLQIVSRLGWSSNNFGSGDGRGADDLFGQAVARRSSGRIPDGTPENGVHLSWGPIWLMLGFMLASSIGWTLGLVIRRRRATRP